MKDNHEISLLPKDHKKSMFSTANFFAGVVALVAIAAAGLVVGYSGRISTFLGGVGEIEGRDSAQLIAEINETSVAKGDEFEVKFYLQPGSDAVDRVVTAVTFDPKHVQATFVNTSTSDLEVRSFVDNGYFNNVAGTLTIEGKNTLGGGERVYLGTVTFDTRQVIGPTEVSFNLDESAALTEDTVNVLGSQTPASIEVVITR